MGIEGFPIHYYDVRGTGAGPPIVLVHGLGGSANGFYKVFFALSKRFSRVLAPDLPGNGFSELPSNDTRGLGARKQLEVLIGFLDTVVKEPAFLVGNSLGGAMCITLAHHAKDRVKALGLVAPAGARVSEDRFAELIRSLQVTTNAEARALTRRLFHKTPISALLLAADMRKMYGTESVKAVLAESTYADLLDPAVLQSLQLPTLLIWGKSERLLPYEGIEFFQEHLPKHAEVHVVEGFGHVPQMERPAELVTHLCGFADRSHL